MTSITMTGGFRTRGCLPSGTSFHFRLILSVFVFNLVISSHARVTAQGSKISCQIPAVQPLANTNLTCLFPEDVSYTKKDFTVYYYKEKERPDAVLDCWWLSGSVDCYVKRGYEYDKKISNRLSLAIPRVSISQMGLYTCQLATYGPESIDTCKLDVQTVDGSVCDIQSVKQESETSLSCYFPVDLSKTRQDFAVYHLSQGVTADVLRCTWEEDNPNCNVAQGFQFDGSVSSHLTLIIPSAFKTHEGTYSCQSTSKEPFSYHTCSFTLHKVTSCLIQSVKEEQPTELRCNFSVDVSATRQNFKVVLQGKDEDILTCTWPDGKLVCSTAPGYEFDNIVTNRLVVVRVPRSSPKQNGTYTCHLQGFDSSDFQSCDFLVTSESVTSLDVGAIVGGVIAAVVVIAIIITVFIVLHKRRQPHQTTVSKEEELSLINKKQEATQKVITFLKESSEKMYQDMETSFFFVPSLYINKNAYRIEEFAGEQIFITQPSNEDDIKHDKAMQDILQNLYHVADSEKEAMFVISQFDYNSYLTTLKDTISGHQLPMPAKLRQQDQNYGDFDLLIVHRQYGLVVVVVKTCSVGSGDGQDDTKLVDEVKKGVNQLLDAEHMLQHLLSDQQWNLAVHKTLMLPNVSEEVLRDELEKHSLEGLVDSNGKMNLALPMLRRKKTMIKTAVQIPSIQNCCLCAERLKSNNEGLKIWLQSVSNGKPMINDVQYLTIISRFCGPASQSPLPVPNTISCDILPVTPEHALCLTGNLFETTILHEDHLSVLKDPPPLVGLCGPPCTGKTRTLELIGRRWMSEGHEVHVVSLWQTSLAASSMLCEVLGKKTNSSHREEGSQAPQGRVVPMAFDLKRDNVKDIVRSIKDKPVQKGALFILCDEVEHDGGNTLFIYFCEKLLKKVPTLHLWYASCFTENSTTNWQVKVLIRPISCPPVILKEKQLSGVTEFYKIPNWALDSNTRTPTEGPPIKYVYHGGEEHSEGDPQGCQSCLEELIRYLQPLFMGKAPLTSEAASIAISTSIGTGSPVSELRLDDKDMMVLTESDVKENVTFVTLLRKFGFKTKLIKEPPTESALKDTSECVLIANGKYVHGIKRKVVVFLEKALTKSKSKKPVKPSDSLNRVRCVTSCTSQLIWVKIS
ncbi:uncharacterized protein LOC112575385 [Pomacea canaliculata]|uniref:uncharacterized protein LOC112575385 n=1 Tax=Pomacea canaliculata TaxID=400727 RepID=UPI000D727B7C|nr:uncharacterized protein LOC112575385 [Pomacea canaliculata]XP_025113006.1 uncharacterized protein LOC112575385 [Pomacea canaliculata]XP_025113007.1 uncharacterized protein LOC112575385 [Pomacea canaliculata]XP_025113008.1 uncharacterized protein LOC112575385 [Pomacea canaliculata]